MELPCELIKIDTADMSLLFIKLLCVVSKRYNGGARMATLCVGRPKKTPIRECLELQNRPRPACPKHLALCV